MAPGLVPEIACLMSNWHASLMRAVFELLLRIQAASGLRFLLIGGWALQAYGYARQTVDVDCMTAVQDEANVSLELNKAGFEPFDRWPAFVRYRHRVNPLKVLDLMMVDAGTFEKCGSKRRILRWLTFRYGFPL